MTYDVVNVQVNNDWVLVECSCLGVNTCVLYTSRAVNI